MLSGDRGERRGRGGVAVAVNRVASTMSVNYPTPSIPWRTAAAHRWPGRTDGRCWLTADKELREFLARAGGLSLGPSDTARYAAQLNEPSPDADIDAQVRSRGRWEVTIRPAGFAPTRVSFSDLEDVVRTAAVKLRGWAFPHVDHRAQVARGVDWVLRARGPAGADIGALSATLIGAVHLLGDVHPPV
jgi:hypothetical protein